MSNFYVQYPAAAAGSNPSTGVNGQPAPASSTEVGGIGPDGNLHAISTDNAGVQNVNVVSSVLPTGASTSAAQATQLTALQAIQASDASMDAKTPALVAGRTPVDGSGVTQPISAAALPLPAGASTSALQTTGNTSLNSIDTKTPALGQAVAASSVPVVLTAAQLSTLTPLTSVQVTQTSGANLHVNVDNFPATQAVSGTVTANQGAAGAAAWKVDGSAVTQPISAAALPLPAGAATSANQTTMQSTLTTIAGNTGKAVGTAIANAPVLNAYSTTNVTTATYTQLIASTTAAANTVDIFDSSGQAMILAVGAAGSEVVQYFIQPGGNAFKLAIPAGSRIAIKALTANATSGYITLNLLQ
jgi:hypothetical protein